MSQPTIHVKNKIEAGEHIKVSPFRKHTRKTEPHKHNNYFEIIYLSEGNGYHTIDSVRYEIQPPTIFLVRKEQVHHWEITSEPEGYVLIIRKSFIDLSLDNELKSLFIKISGSTCLNIADWATIERLFELLTQENAGAQDYSFPIVEGLLKALLAKVLEVSKPVICKAEIKTGLYQSFRELLSRNRELKNKVAYYAECLNTTPQNLNAACRKAVNQSAAEVLGDFILSEAKRLLLYTNNTVSEISFTLDFHDASHFVKYFKKHIGQTPHSFRSANN